MHPNKPLIELKIDRLSHDGRGIAQHEEKTWLVANALPQETVLASKLRQHKSVVEALAMQVVQPSQERIAPFCASFGQCAGCSQQHLAPEEQLKLKILTLQDHIKHFGSIALDTNKLAPTLTGPQTHYRRKARLSVRWHEASGTLFLGFREWDGRKIARGTECPILLKPLAMLVPWLHELIPKLSIRSHIPQIDLAAGDEEAALILRHLEPLSAPDNQRLSDFGKTHGIRVLTEPNAPAALQQLYPKQASVGSLTYCLQDQALNLSFLPKQFVQINPFVNRSMVTQACAWLAPSSKSTVLDLFCGMGNFTLPLAQQCQRVDGVESEWSSVGMAQVNAERHRLSNAHFQAADLFEPSWANTWPWQRYTHLLLDPPRTGALDLLPAIVKSPVERIVYVSCNTATLARDLGYLVHQGHFTIEQLGLIDLFPHTSHAEAMVALSR